jgi:phosphatidylinositol kinase/protein kinase (PI-3  family)
MGVTGVEGVFRIACEETLRVLRSENKIILMILEVFRHDPLYRWSASERRQEKITCEEKGTGLIEERSRGNKEAARALLGYLLFQDNRQEFKRNYFPTQVLNVRSMN